MWFETRENPDSLEATLAKQLCKDPAQVYLDENPEISETIETEEEKLEWVQVVEGIKVEEEEPTPNNNMTLIIAAGSGIAILITLMVITITCCCRKKRKLEPQEVKKIPVRKT